LVIFDEAVPSMRRPGVTIDAIDKEIGLGAFVTERDVPDVVGVVEQLSADREWLVVAWPTGDRDVLRIDDAVVVLDRRP
jgi:hypothetical protein